MTAAGGEETKALMCSGSVNARESRWDLGTAITHGPGAHEGDLVILYVYAE